MNVVLIGYRGCGKSAVGKELARRLGWPMVDTDRLVEQGAGASIRDLFADRAEQGFRELEAAVVEQVADFDSHVISTGGGVVLREENTLALKRNGKLVWLTAPPEVLWERILGDYRRLATRPKIDLAAGLDQIRNALRARHALYEQAADITVQTQGRTIQSVVERILTRAHLRPRA